MITTLKRFEISQSFQKNRVEFKQVVNNQSNGAVSCKCQKQGDQLSKEKHSRACGSGLERFDGGLVLW